MTNQLQQHQQRRTVDLRIPTIEKYAYCLCLHVRPATIFIAVFMLIRALLSASIQLNTEFSMNEQVHELTLGTLEDRHRSTAIALTILSRIIVASVSAVGIYAVISGRAALLMPLYAMLLVDFFFSLPAFYNRSLDPSISDGIADFRAYSPGTNQYAPYSAMLLETISMVVKIYSLCVIWKCYRYLRLIELVSPLRLSEIYPHIHQTTPQYPILRVIGNSDSTDLTSGHNVAPPPYESIASNMKPPNYEEAIKSSNNVILAANQNYNHQQTVVLSNPIIDQNISTHVIAERINVAPTLENITVDHSQIGNVETTSTASTVVARDITDSGCHIHGEQNNPQTNDLNNDLSNNKNTESGIVITNIEQQNRSSRDIQNV